MEAGKGCVGLRVCVARAMFQQRQSPGKTCQVSEGNTPCSAHQIVHIVEILQRTSTWINITQPNRSGQRRNQVFFSLRSISGSSSFELRHLRPTATPVPALVDPDPPLNPIWIYC